MGQQKNRGLPENAYRPLKEGEKYIPFIPAEEHPYEVTTRSVLIGIFMAAIFTFATAYSGLKAGQVFEAAIPIAILAVGIGKMFKRNNTILENVIIQSIGACSGVVVAGAIFTLPALYMLKLDPSYITVVLASFLGGVLGIVFLIPLRKYFVADQHGLLPFPEATATTEILVTGEKAGKQAQILIKAMLLGGLYDFISDTFKFWNTSFTTNALGKAFQHFTDKTKMIFKMETTAFFVGLGYIVGLRYAAIICGGSFIAWFVLVPFFGYTMSLHGAVASTMTPDFIFNNYVRMVGIGGIAAAGILGILKNSKIIVSSFSVGFKGIFKKGKETKDVERTAKDIPMYILIVILVATLIILLAFFFTITNRMDYALLGLLIAFFISFLFTTVAARAIAIVGTNPVSGMTLVTLILGSVILVKAGLHGNSGMFTALVIGSVVCTALSVSGGFITDLKIGYWTGATPFNQERFKFLGTLVAAIFVGAAIILINNAFGFLVFDPISKGYIPNPNVPAPQANVMKDIIVTLMDPKANIPWMLYGIGILLALIMDMVGVPALAFALGMYLPQELNTPLVLGGFIAYLLAKSSKNKKVSQARFQKGTLIASGFIAGSALMGILGAVLKIIPSGNFVNKKSLSFIDNILVKMGILDPKNPDHILRYLFGSPHLTAILGLVFVLILSGYVIFDSFKVNSEE